MSQPLILTLLLNDEAQAFYEDLRRCHFPPERNLIAAHVTLFHQLPDDELTRQTLSELARGRSVFRLNKPTTRSIGRGVAVFFESDPLAALHSDLSIAFEPCLIPQDRQRFRSHIVVQNKVDAETARHTLWQLRNEVLTEPYAKGLSLWRYMGGPWEHLCDFHFAVI